ncbi:D-lactate dehydrogenase [cytochrome] 1, mitochondrial [[Candida] railenensis]|uniref:D-lactate dehydrogenase (cytochrome) n=1 Tax=[Candida] railenensis TaxID=45579 RepID=A0A9P0QKL4_9ASCO|nr:D-lactate dehydrogenase [cytochrome] 1, mitochondrial [[Candida] railenensis]
MIAIRRLRQVPRLRVSQALTRRQYSTTKPGSASSLKKYGIYGVGLLSGVVGTELYSRNAAAGKVEAIDASTTPLQTLDTPEYANEEDYRTALRLIAEIVGSDRINTDEVSIDSHADSFFSTHHPPNPTLQKPGVIVLPENTQEVSEILKIAHKYRVPVVPSSGLTSLEGHYMHTRGPRTISLSFTQMDQVLALHPNDLDVVVQPGVGWQELDSYLLNDPEGKYLMFGPDPGPGAQIGGMVASSCSGTNAYKYGTMKENVINLTVVLADGTIIKTKQRPRKSSAGYDTTRIFIGSEGTLGVITEATLKLHVRPKLELVSIASFPTIADAAATAQYIISKSGLQPNAIEILDSTMVSFVNSAQGENQKKFLEQPTLFFKLGGPTKESITEQVNLVKEVSKKNNLIKFESSSNAEENAVLWAARRNGLWSTIDYGSQILEDKEDVQVWTTDVAVPISNLTEMIRDTNNDLVESGFNKKFSVMGHIGDGNCHFLLLYNSKDYAKAQVLVDRMVHRALKLEGTCTGEHGVGIGKRRYLEEELGVTTIDFMRQLKLAIDPRRILNPDKVIKIDRNDSLDEEMDAGHIIEAKPCCH